MLFTWDTNNLCIIFRQWRITGTMSLIFSLLGVVALTAGYEVVREISRRYEMRCARESKKLTRMSFPFDGRLLLLPITSEYLVSSWSEPC